MPLNSQTADPGRGSILLVHLEVLGASWSEVPAAWTSEHPPDFSPQVRAPQTLNTHKNPTYICIHKFYVYVYTHLYILYVYVYLYL